MTREIIQARCERGAQIALALGFPPLSSAVRNTHESSGVGGHSDCGGVRPWREPVA